MSDARATGNNSINLIYTSQYILFMQERTKWNFRPAPSQKGLEGKAIYWKCVWHCWIGTIASKELLPKHLHAIKHTNTTGKSLFWLLVIPKSQCLRVTSRKVYQHLKSNSLSRLNHYSVKMQYPGLKCLEKFWASCVSNTHHFSQCNRNRW